MANLKLMCLTWNQELADIHKKDIQPLMELIRDERPDLIIIGLQEAKPTGMFHKPSKSFAFVGEKIAANLVRDYHLNNYRFLGRQSFRGVTKLTQVVKSVDPTRSQLARQVIEVIASNPNITLSRTKYYQTKFLREKGFVFAEVQFNNRRLAFICTHLDSGTNVEKRRRMAYKIREKLHDWNNNDPHYNALFVMGDMNYRVRRPAEWFGNVSEAESQLIIEKLYTRAERQQLMREDSFIANPDNPVSVGALRFDRGPAELDSLNMNWIPFDRDALPTYKRSTKTDHKGYAAWRRLRGPDRWNNGSIPHGMIYRDGRYDRDVALTVYLKDKKLKVKRAGFYDFGWLDRIGMRTSRVFGDRLIINGNPVSLLRPNEQPTLKSMMQVTGGDHVPVYTILNFKGF
jgi:hypothetical protein